MLKGDSNFNAIDSFYSPDKITQTKKNWIWCNSNFFWKRMIFFIKNIEKLNQTLPELIKLS